MREIILDERAWAENALYNPSLGAKPAETLGRIARYYHANGFKRKEITKKLEDYVTKCEPDASITRWQALIDAVAKNASKYKLVDIGGVPISRKEMDTVNAIDSVRIRKLLFTLICLAKYGNSVNETNDSWVNMQAKDIFSLANVTKMSLERQALIINDMWVAGYISFSKIVDNTNIHVNVISDEGGTAMTVYDFRNIGNQYMQLCFPTKYMECSNCGTIIKRNSAAQKYCPECAVNIHRDQIAQKYLLSKMQ